MTSKIEILSDRAGRLIAKHAMYWKRRLNAPVEDVWPIISTKEGLETWWIVPPRVFDLRVGGDFNHHWDQTITSFEDHRYIDFVEPLSACRGTGGMRFELTAVGPRETVFLFLDTCGADLRASEFEIGMSSALASKSGDLETISPSIAAGWHGMVDGLARQFGNDVPPYTEEELSAFYVDYLEEQLRLSDMVQRLPQDDVP